MIIHIDAGHGGRWPKGDPGVVSKDQTKIESEYAYLYANSLASHLENKGFTVRRTRVQDEYKTDLRERTKGTNPGDVFISLHFDYAGGSKLVYYGQQADSPRLAQDVDAFFGSGKIIPTTTSRFGRLYIDDARCPSILIEVDRIEDATKDPGYIQQFCENVEKGIRRFKRIEEESPLPFRRVFIVGAHDITEVNIEKMTLVGDKLYVRTDDLFF